VFTQDTTNSLLWTQSGVLAAAGLDNIVVVQTEDATLVCDRSRTEEIKSLVARVKAHNSELANIHVTAHRPWGTYTVLEEGADFKIKRIVVKPGNRLSLQMHHHRSEHWVVVSGMARVTNGEQEFFVSQNESTFIPAGCKHRLENPGVLDLVMIEVQSGDYVGEDDIVRFDDSYGRVIEKNE
jgi:mannose-1-phosphate guanylyltransferase/mannose-6-phosphate isomerase